MNTRVFKTSLFCAALLCAALPAFAQGGSPRTGTDAALQCLMRQGPKDCQTMFVGSAWTAAQPWVWNNPTRDLNRGPLQSSDYWGQASPDSVFDQRILLRSTTGEMDIFDVKFAHQEYSIYIAPAGDDGKIRDLAIRLYAPHDLNQLAAR